MKSRTRLLTRKVRVHLLKSTRLGSINSPRQPTSCASFSYWPCSQPRAAPLSLPDPPRSARPSQRPAAAARTAPCGREARPAQRCCGIRRAAGRGRPVRQAGRTVDRGRGSRCPSAFKNCEIRSGPADIGQSERLARDLRGLDIALRRAIVVGHARATIEPTKDQAHHGSGRSSVMTGAVRLRQGPAFTPALRSDVAAEGTRPVMAPVTSRT